nr:hypothetical protein [Tanacetum cinerariifolium]
MEDTMLELVKICQEKEFLCIHDDINDLIESALNSKLLLINSNSQHLDKKQQEVKNIVEQPAERGNLHAVAQILSTKEPEHLLSMGYEHLSITPETESNEVTESNAKNLLPIPSKCKVALEDKRECVVPISKNSPVCDNNYDIFSDSKIDDEISVYDDDFKDIEYVEASLFDPEIVNQEEENVVQQEEEEIDLEDISQIQDIVLCEKLLSITRLISNIESLNDNPTPDHVLNSFESDNSLLNNFSPEFKTFCDHSEETRSGEYSQWVERFMNYRKEQTDEEAMINSIKNGDQPLPLVTQVSIAGTTSTEQPPLKDKSMCSNQEKRVQKINRLARSLLIQGLSNDIYSLIDSNKTAKDLWDALARHMLGSEYGEQDRKAANMNLMDINFDALYNILKQNQGDVNHAIGSKKKTVVVTSDPLALIDEKTNMSRSKEKVVVSSDSEGSEANDFNELKKITALLAKAFN